MTLISWLNRIYWLVSCNQHFQLLLQKLLQNAWKYFKVIWKSRGILFSLTCGNPVSCLVIRSSNVAVLREMNADYQQCVSTCKQLSQRSSQCDLTARSSLSAASLTTDRLLYSCAIEMVCSALLLVDIPFCMYRNSNSNTTTTRTSWGEPVPESRFTHSLLSLWVF